MKARFLKESALNDLWNNVAKNLDQYRNGDFEEFLERSENYFEGAFEIDKVVLSEVTASGTELNEVDSCLKVYAGVGRISEYLAREQRFWVYLTHSVLLKYTRDRWPIPEDDVKAVKAIRTHFFANGGRGIERDNAASRLWWMAILCDRCEGIELKEALECFLLQSDVRANIVERPSTSQNINVFTAIVQRLRVSFHSDQALYNRERFRLFMKKINLYGGIKLLATLPMQAIEEILDRCLEESSL